MRRKVEVVDVVVVVVVDAVVSSRSSSDSHSSPHTYRYHIIDHIISKHSINHHFEYIQVIELDDWIKLDIDNLFDDKPQCEDFILRLFVGVVLTF